MSIGRVYVDGVFDMFHIGHIRFLKKCKSLATTLIVGVCSDINMEKIKRKPIINQDMRLEVVQACKYCDEAFIPEELVVTESFLQKHNIDMVIHADDYSKKTIETYYSEPLKLSTFMTLPYTNGISTTDIINTVKKYGIENTEVDCSKVCVKTSTFSSPDNIFYGAFATCDIKAGELIEKGLMKRLSDNQNKCFDGMKNPYVFTWSDDQPNYTWAYPSGCLTFYNTGLENETNTKLIRHFDEDKYEVYAVKDIKAGEELTHTYKSLKWRTVFTSLYNELSEKK